MAKTLGQRISSAWNAFRSAGVNVTTPASTNVFYGGSYYKPDRVQLTRGGERTIITSIFNRISIDVAAIDIKHIKLDSNQRYIEDIDSGLNTCLNLSANLDQTGRALIQDAVLSLLDEGVIAILPIDTTSNPDTGNFEINSLRVGKIIEWYPDHIKVNAYNEKTGLKEDLYADKKTTAIIENPLYIVMNEQNSTLKRLVNKLNLIDVVDEKNSSGKLDLIIQLPYTVKTETRRQQAKERRNDIETQLIGSTYGIAYVDATEKITQLNRPVNNDLMGQVEYLTSMLYSQLGMTESVLNGTASEAEILAYSSRTIEPIVAAIVDEMKRKFLSETARAESETLRYFSKPFKLVPAKDMAEVADKFTRNEILSSNEVREIIGYKPSSDPKADQLVNANINQYKGGSGPGESNTESRQASSDVDVEP